MKRLLMLMAVQLAMLSAASAADAVSVRFSAAPCGRFVVDGQKYQNTATFLWAVNSTHTVTTEGSYAISNDRRCEASGGWVDDTSGGVALPASTSIYVTGPAAYSMSWRYSYRLVLILNNNTGNPAFDCNGTAFATVGGACYDRDTALWQPAGTFTTVSVRPPSGFVFLGWGADRYANSATISFTQNSPMVLRPQWRPAANFTLKTDPPGLKVLVDRTPVVTPVTLEWAAKSVHALSPLIPQDKGQWAFVSWSDGGAENRTVTAPASGEWAEMTLNYGHGTKCTFGTTPAGLKLAIDGSTNWPNYSFQWLLGSKHTISAPLEQVDSTGRKYTFKHWTTGGPAEQEYTVVAPPHKLTSAVYTAQGQLLIESASANAQVLVDGVSCPTPCAVNRAAGSEVRIAAPAKINVGDYERLEFTGWSDGGPVERVWKATNAGLTLAANFSTSYRTVAFSDPAGGATFSFEPASEDAFFPADSMVTVTAETKPGYTFRTWDGETQTGPSLKLRMYAPRGARAILDSYPFLSGVINAAGETPEPNVAPGSIVSIQGANLAETTENGSENPLAQTIAGVTVQIKDRLLPLFSVSPVEVTAQLPSNLAAGSYTLVLHQDGREDASVKFNVKRNAPGLFTQVSGEETYALALHDDGKQVTAENPAARGETITLLGTGFGPARPMPLDGFAVPVEPKTAQYPLLDSVEIRSGDKLVLAPLAAQVAKGYIGTVAVRVKIPADTPAGPALELRAAVKDPADRTGKTFHESNKVLVPLKN